MLSFFVVASLAAQPMAPQFGYAELSAGDPEAAIQVIEHGEVAVDDPARLINLGIAHARTGDRAKARSLFLQAYNAREWVELETVNGPWADSRSLARRALTLLDNGEFETTRQIARK